VNADQRCKAWVQKTIRELTPEVCEHFGIPLNGSILVDNLSAKQEELCDWVRQRLTELLKTETKAMNASILWVEIDYNKPHTPGNTNFNVGLAIAGWLE
jgi:hypothetical protein